MFHATEAGEIAISIENPDEILTSFKGLAAENPLGTEKRKAIRYLGNMLADNLEERGKTRTHRIVPLDVQYDGEDKTAAPSVIFGDPTYAQLRGMIYRFFNSGEKWARKGRDEYMGYLNQCFPGKARLSAKVPKESCESKFDKLSNQYKATKDEALLIPLISAAEECISNANGHPEACEEYGGWIEEFVDLAKQSKVPEISAFGVSYFTADVSEASPTSS
jgi:hypothetical protein